MPSKSFWDHPIDKIEEALSIRKQIAALQDKLSGMFGPDDEPATKPSKPGKRGGKRKMSAATIAKMKAAQQARWAKKRGTSATPVTVAAQKSVTKPVAAPKKKKGGLTAEGRAKLAAAMKARWAARKKGGPALNAPK